MGLYSAVAQAEQTHFEGIHWGKRETSRDSKAAAEAAGDQGSDSSWVQGLSWTGVRCMTLVPAPAQTASPSLS